MFGISYIRIAVALALVVAIAGAAWKLHHSGVVEGKAEGKAEVQTSWDADKLQRTEKALTDSETNRLRERAAQKHVAKVDNDLQAQKTFRIAADKLTADRVQRLEALLANPNPNSASSNSATTSGVDGDDPRNRIASECPRALAALDQAYGKLVGKTRALQGYATDVCMMP